MDSQVLHIAGPDGAPYQFGQPMLMLAGQRLLGQVDSVRLGHGGEHVHFASLAPVSDSRDEPRDVCTLLLYEACAHITRFHPQVQLISFASSRSVSSVDEPAFNPAAQVAAVERIGAQDIQVTPVPSGLLVVSGTWAYNERNQHQLDIALEEHRAIYREFARSKYHDRPGSVWRRRIRRLFP